MTVDVPAAAVFRPDEANGRFRALAILPGTAGIKRKAAVRTYALTSAEGRCWLRLRRRLRISQKSVFGSGQLDCHCNFALFGGFQHGDAPARLFCGIEVGRQMFGKAGC